MSRANFLPRTALAVAAILTATVIPVSTLAENPAIHTWVIFVDMSDPHKPDDTLVYRTTFPSRQACEDHIVSTHFADDLRALVATNPTSVFSNIRCEQTGDPA